ncbi:MAG TPA: glycosyltransferase family 39 protein [Vicinamibacteria bacterium]|nr:glycosyltransferase family 39 protein [Vicinamibacteria bacterium]
MSLRGSVTAALGTAVLVVAAYQRPVTLEALPASTRDAVGFGAKGMTQGRSWRFTSARSTVRIPLAGQILPAGARLRVEVGLPRWAAAKPRRVILALDGQLLGAIDVREGFDVHEFELAGDRRSSGDWTLSLSTEEIGLGPDDTRGVALARVELRQPPPPSAPALRSLILAVLGVVALWALVAPKLHSRSSKGIVVLAAVAAFLGLAFARPQTVALLPWASGALALLAATDALRRGLSPPAAARVAAVAPAVALLALAAGGLRLEPVLASVVALGAVALGSMGSGPIAAARPVWARREWGLVLALTALALAFRIYRLDEIPFAIFRDEARHGALALRLLGDSSYRPLFVGPPINQPLPYFLAVAQAIKAFGANLFALRIVSAVAGALAVPLLYGLVREVFGPREGFVAALLLAVSSWSVTISRFAVNYVEPSLFSLPAYWLLWRALPHARFRGLCFAAFLVGLGQYSAHTAKALLVVTAGLVVEELARRALSKDVAGLRKLALGLFLAAAALLATLTPILLFVRENPDDYLARAQQVSVWSHARAEGESPATMPLQNLRSYILAFHVSGDPNGRHHLPEAPLLDPVSGLGLLAGLGLTFTGLRSPACRFLLLWLVAGLLPGLLTVDAPSALRTIEAAPAVYAACAVGLIALWDGRPRSDAKAWRAWGIGVLAGAVAWNAWVYFVRMYESPAVWLASSAMGTPVGRRLSELGRQGLLPEQLFLAVPRRFWEDTDNPDVMRFFWPRGLKVGVYDDPAPLAQRPDVYLLPNDADLWRLAATEDPANGPAAARALAEQARLRERLGSASSDPVALGPPFPGTDVPTAWLYMPPRLPAQR